MRSADDELFDGMRGMIAGFSPDINKHDQVHVLIIACIDRGLNTGVRIVRALKALGYNARHVGMLLKAGAGVNPERHTWRCDSEGCYSLHPEDGAKAQDD